MIKKTELKQKYKQTVKKNKKIIIIFRDMGLGGIQRKIIDIIEIIQKKHPEFDIVVCLRHFKGIFLKKIPKDITVISPSINSSLPHFDSVLFSFWMIYTILKFNPTHILSFMDFCSISTLNALQMLFWKKSIKVSIGEDILTSKFIQNENKMPKIRFKLIKFFYPKANKILVQTKIQKDDLVKILGKKNSSKIIISPNWLSLGFPPKSIISKTRPTDIVFIGRIEPQKNLPKLINVVKLVSEKYPNLNVKIIGSGSQLKIIKKLIKKQRLENIISILPPTIHPEKFYQESKIFLLTSDFEGFPLTLMEAISCGCYPIVNNIPEINPFFDKNSKQIIFSKIKTAAKLIDNILSKDNNSNCLLHYQQKIRKLQIENINKYVLHLLFKK